MALSEYGKKWMREHYPEDFPDEPSINGEQPHDDTGEHRQADDDSIGAIEKMVRSRQAYLRIDREARRRLDDEDRPPIILPELTPLDALLAQPRTPTRYRIDKVAPEGSRSILSARYKAGKTTVVANLLRALVDDDSFLSRFAVNTLSRRVVLIDNELSPNMLLDWYADQNIANTAAITPIALRGKVGTLNLIDQTCRALWADRLRETGCDYLILDCLRPVLDALGLDEGRDAGRFLVAFDALLHDAGIADALIVHHMGHAGERARGDSRLQDWPDAIWRIVSEDDNPSSPRYFTAYGRDVDVREGRLSYDPASRRLSYAAGSRRDARTEAAYVAVIAFLAEDAKAGGQGVSKNGIETELPGSHNRQAVRDAMDKAVDRGIVTVEKGSRGSHTHRIANPCSACGLPVIDPDRIRHVTCPAEPEVPDGLFEI
jgi:hypothetical protein